MCHHTIITRHAPLQADLGDGILRLLLPIVEVLEQTCWFAGPCPPPQFGVIGDFIRGKLDE